MRYPKPKEGLRLPRKPDEGKTATGKEQAAYSLPREPHWLRLLRCADYFEPLGF